MSRSGYSENLDEWALIRWRGAVKKALRGERGQAFLREMLTAMDAMPEKALISGELIDSDGACCAMGTVCKARGLDVSNLDYEASEDVGGALGIARAMAAEISYENDECGPPHWNKPGGETPQERFIRMRTWIASKLRAHPAQEQP